MTDKERIEEMARIIHFDYWGDCRMDSCSDCPHSDLNICDDKKIAEKLYNKLFPEGSVVLSNEVFERLSIFKVEIAQRIKTEARKETAREIFAWLKEHCDYAGFTIIEAYFKETFGVEVEE